MRRVPVALLFAVVVAGCGSDGPTAPTPAQETRIIRLSGDMNFGIVEVGQSSERILNVANDGTAPLAISGLSGPAGTANIFTTSGANTTIQPGATTPILIRFSPTRPISYSGTFTVSANHTGGLNTNPFSGAGQRTGDLWTMSGHGNTVFDMPVFIERVRIQGRWNRRDTSNFAVRLNGRLLVNEILRESLTYDGIHLASGGGTVEITISNQIDWAFTEVR